MSLYYILFTFYPYLQSRLKPDRRTPSGQGRELLGTDSLLMIYFRISFSVHPYHEKPYRLHIGAIAKCILFPIVHIPLKSRSSGRQ